MRFASLAERRLAAWAFACLFLASVARPARADVATLASARDNTLYESSTGALSNGAGVNMFAGRTNQASNSRRRALVFFDVAAGIPAGSTVQSAQLRLTCDQSPSAIAQGIALRHALANWGQGTSDAGFAGGAGAAATPGDATWRYTFFATSTWASLGGDFSPVASASTGVTGAGNWTWGSTSAMVSDVQGWLDAPATNFGWLVLGNESTAATAERFLTREAADPAVVPTLTVEYTPPSTPTRPASWGEVKGRYR